MPAYEDKEKAKETFNIIKENLDNLVTLFADAIVEANPNETDRDVTENIQNKNIRYGALIRLGKMEKYKDDPLLIAALATQDLSNKMQESLDNFVTKNTPETLAELVGKWEDDMTKPNGEKPPFEKSIQHSSFSERLSRAVQLFLNGITNAIRTLKSLFSSEEKEEVTPAQATTDSLLNAVKSVLKNTQTTAVQKTTKEEEESRSSRGPKPGGSSEPFDPSDGSF